MGALENRQFGSYGGPGSSGGHGGARSSGGPCGRGLCPHGPATPAGTIFTLLKNIHEAAIRVSAVLRGGPQEQEPILG